MDDPFDVLGIPPTEDEREIKKAYARLIKVHRPDRDPDAFERVHRAYEAALGGSDETDWESPAPSKPASRPAAFTPDLPWSGLRAHLDGSPDELAAVLEERFERLYEDGAYQQLWSEVCDPVFIGDVIEHPAIALPALHVLAGMAWYTTGAHAVLARLRTIPVSYGLEHVIDHADDEVALAHGFFQLRDAGSLDVGGRGVPEHLVRVFGDLALASTTHRAQVLRDASSLLADPWYLLGFCDRLAPADPPLALALVERLSPEIPADRRSADALPPDARQALGDRIDHLGSGPWHQRARHSGVGRFVVSMLRESLLVKLHGGLDDEPQVPADYTRRQRPAFAVAMHELGVPAVVVREWITAHGGTSGYARFVATLLDADLGLALYGVLVSILKPS